VTEDVAAELASSVRGWSREGVEAKHAQELNLDTADRCLAFAMELAKELINTPRHISQHAGGQSSNYGVGHQGWRSGMHRTA